MCLFDENLGNIDQNVDNTKIFDNGQSTELTETIIFSSYSSICNCLHNVIKSKNKITTFLFGKLLKMREVIVSKKINI